MISDYRRHGNRFGGRGIARGFCEHSLLENDLQRRPVAGMADFYREILARNPLSAAAPSDVPSPRRRASSRRASALSSPATASRPGRSSPGRFRRRRQRPLFDQAKYKTDRIEQILEDLPAVRFILVGDDGERDPETYRTIRDSTPPHFKLSTSAALIPTPGAGPTPATQAGGGGPGPQAPALLIPSVTLRARYCWRHAR